MGLVGVLPPEIPAIEGGIHQDDSQGAGNNAGGGKLRIQGVQQGGDDHTAADAEKSCGKAAQGAGQKQKQKL